MTPSARRPISTTPGHTAESIPRCHRSASAEVFIGIAAKNLACSGAKTTTFFDSSGNFKPVLDFYSGSRGVGQARALQDFASTHKVRTVAVSIGGNDFGFAGVITSCVTDWLTSFSWFKNYCQDDSSVRSNFTSTNVAARTADIRAGLLNLRTAMRNAGYADGTWTLVAQTYESPTPPSSGFRYPETGLSRQTKGGCEFWNADANWAGSTALPTINTAVTSAVAQAGIAGAKVLDVSGAFNGRRLCENTVGLLEEKGLGSWTATGASDNTEWVNTIRTVTTCCGNYYLQESLHPNYWGQLALRNCLRQVYNGGAVRGGTCVRNGTGRNAQGEPSMALVNVN